MGDITSLKVRLARLRLAGSKSKEISERIRNRRKPIEEEEEPQTRKATKDPGYGEYTKNTGGKRKKVNKLTRSDQKRGKKVTKKKKRLPEEGKLTQKELDTEMDDMFNWADQGGRYDKKGNPVIDRDPDSYSHYTEDKE